MKKVVFNFILIIWLTSGSAKNSAHQNNQISQPNIVFILIDDMGYGELACYGNMYHRTPNIDQLGESGIRFTEAYAHPTCSPTRAALLTGKAPGRLHLTDFISGKLGGSVANEKGQGYPYPDRSNLIQPDMQNPGISTKEPTIANVFRKEGYATGFVGKWHLGATKPGEHGFNWVRYITENGRYPVLENGRFLEEIKTDAAIQFIEEHIHQPFFLYLSLNAVHPSVIQSGAIRDYYRTRPELIQPFSSAPDTILAAVINHVDNQVGRLVQKLGELGIKENTIIIFLSDNGATHPGHGRNHPLRGHKGNLYEGGVRVPFIIAGPGVTQPGRICNSFLIAEDFYPTLIDIAGLSHQPNQQLDGISFAPLIRMEKDYVRDTLFWHYPHWFRPQTGPKAFSPASAIRLNNWKLIHFFENNSTELYNIEEDIGESNDLTLDYPELVEEMLEELNNWRIKVNAQIPKRK